MVYCCRSKPIVRLDYSDDFTFIPLKIKSHDFLIQTPRLFTPYGIQQNDKLKIILCYHFKTKQTINIQINF